jgi:hypothetical protein
MEMVSLKEGSIMLEGKSYSFKIYAQKKSARTNGLWRMLRFHDLKGKEIVTIYNVLKDNLRNIIITSLRDMNFLSKKRQSNIF